MVIRVVSYFEECVAVLVSFKNMLCKFIPLFVVLSVHTVHTYCPNGWIRYDNSCYLFEDTKESWHIARVHCRGLKADLLVPETDHENRFIKSYLTKLYKGCTQNDLYWFGANDLSIEGDWEWVTTGRTMTLTDWAPNEPADQRAANCASYNGRLNFTWDDSSCDTQRKFICEIRDLIDEADVDDAVMM